MRKITTYLRSVYLDQDVIEQSVQNCIDHIFELNNVIDYRHGNMFLPIGQTYSAQLVNFLIFASNFDIQLTIDGVKQFSTGLFVLVQREVPFSFTINPIVVPSGCSINLHYLHGKIGPS